MVETIEQVRDSLVQSFVAGLAAGNFDNHLTAIDAAVVSRLAAVGRVLPPQASGAQTTTSTKPRIPAPPKTTFVVGENYEMVKSKSGKYDGAIVAFVSEAKDESGRIRVKVMDGCTTEQRGKTLVIPRNAIRKIKK